MFIFVIIRACLVIYNKMFISLELATFLIFIAFNYFPATSVLLSIRILFRSCFVPLLVPFY